MHTSAADPLLELPAWQALLDRDPGVFADLVPGATIGLVPRFVRSADGTRRASAMPKVPSMDMLVWSRHAKRMEAELREFAGLKNAAVDVLFFVEREALASVLEHRDPLGEMTRAIRGGRILLMVMRTRQELAERGFEALFDALGLPFMGACR